MDFSRKRVIVTGPAGTISWGIVAAFFRDGASVLLSDPRMNRREELAAGLGLARERHLVHPTDVPSVAAIAEAVRLVRQAWGGIDILVNNAACTPITC